MLKNIEVNKKDFMNMKKKTTKKESKGAISRGLILLLYVQKLIYILGPQFYPFIDGASTAARSRGKL